jgi:cytochrome c-type biogenesis protein CcmH
MMLWSIFTLMTLAAVFAVWWPLARGRKSVRSGSDVAVYRDQLDEIDRDQAASLIGGVEAEAARVEVSRRLIAAAEAAKAGNTAAAPVPARNYRWATLAAAIVVLPLGACLTYLWLGSPNLVPVSLNAEAGGQQLPEGIEQTVVEVEKYLESNPKNGRGWELLAPVYLRLGRFDDAVTARRNALEIFGPDAARLGDLGEAIIMASGGVVTPEAKDLFTRANVADPEDVMAQYYLGLSAKQEGRRDEAVKRWTALISSAREGAEWLPMVKAALARVDQTGPSVATAAPSADGAPPDHGDGAIEAMVARLAERLKTNGSDVPGWIQLVRSYRVLGRAEKANAAIADAHAALASDQEALQRLDRGLQGLEAEAAPGVPGAGAAIGAPSALGIAPPGPTTSQVAAAAQMVPAERNSMIEGMVARLAARLKTDGSDVRGWIQLVRSYRVLGNPDAAKAAIADARAALANDREGLQQLEEGLEVLQAEAAPGASAPAPATAISIPQPGPNASQVAAAAQMAPAERNSMIESMVARLAQRMVENGSDVDGWLRLIRAYSVLGERDKALTAAANARGALAGNSDNLRRIGELTKELGLEGS